jgi:hypothetical protein
VARLLRSGSGLDAGDDVDDEIRALLRSLAI